LHIDKCYLWKRERETETDRQIERKKEKTYKNNTLKHKTQAFIIKFLKMIIMHTTQNISELR